MVRSKVKKNENLSFEVDEAQRYAKCIHRLNLCELYCF